ncbi:MAG: UTP--glucose-1-phosphate uridylyltransferase [Anaerolineae bacterium]
MTAPAESFAEKFAPFAARMEREGLPDLAINTFAHYYRRLLQGKTGLIPEADILPVGSLPDAETLSPGLTAEGEAALPHTVLIKLNGGLGTSMGLAQAKSLLIVKNSLSFLDIIARQAMQAGIPLVLMNSFATRADSLAALENYPALRGRIPLDFVQHKVPKIARASLSPVEWPADPALEWCPPGHGDLYTALLTSGMLAALLRAGYKYAFVSNADNLGAVIDAAILGHFARHNFPFMMEVADRTGADKKGGHLARLPNGQLILRESAQCPPGDAGAFQNITRHRYFNTNSLWLNLPALEQTLAAKNNILGLPMIRNAKTVNPRDADSTPVYQLETAMGSAIAVFAGAAAIRVPRTRFAPVKTTGDLLAVRSDAYTLTPDFRVIPNPARQSGPPVIDLDARYYKLINQLEARFPRGAPSLLACRRLSVQGDFKFGANVTLRGNVRLTNTSAAQATVEAGAVITG